MKISELSTDAALDVLVRITEPFMRIISDEKIMDVFSNKLHKADIETKGQQVTVFAKTVSSMIPILLKDHKDDTCEIIAAINEKTVDEIKSMNIIKTMILARECVLDADLIAFFKSCVNSEKSGA